MYYLISSGFNFVTWTILSLVVFLWNPKGRLNRAFAFFGFSIAFWSFGYTLWQFYQHINPDPVKSLFWIRFAMIGATIIPVTMTEFTLRYINLEKKYWVIRIINISICIFLVLFSRSPWFIKGSFPILSFPYWPDPGILLHFQFLTFVLNVVWSHWMMVKTWKETSGITRTRLGFVLLAALIGFGGGTTNYIPWYHIPIPPIGNICVSIYAGIVAYTIVRYRLLDIERVALYVFLAILVYVPLLGIPFWMKPWMEGFLGVERAARYEWMRLVVMAALASCGPFLFGRLRARAEKKKDEELLEKVKKLRVASDYMVRQTELENLLKLIVHRVVKTLHLSHAAIYLKEEPNAEGADSKGFHLGWDWGPGQRSLRLPEKIEEDSELVQLLSRKEFSDDKEPLETEGIGHRLSAWGLDSLQAERLETECFSMEASVVIPAYETEQALFGFLALGRTEDGKLLEKEILQQLVLLSNQAVSAIKNNQAIGKLKEFYQGMQNTEKLASLGMFISSLAHDVNNPLAIVSGYSQMLKRKWEKSNERPEEMDMLKRIDDAALRAAGVLRALKDLSKPADQEKELFDEIEVDPLVLKTVEFVKGPLVFDHVQITSDLQAQGKILGNNDQLDRVFTNLLKNAWEAMKETNGEKKIQLSSRRIGETVQIVIEDTGPGIPPERLRTLFRPFYTTKKEGTGLGLSTCKMIIEGHRGKIRCESTVGKGTKFIIELPVYIGKLKRGVWRQPR